MKVVVALPVGMRYVPNEFAVSLANMIARSEHEVCVIYKDRTIVQRARDWLATKFLSMQGWDYLLQLDSDMVFPDGSGDCGPLPAPYATVNAIDRLVSRGVDVVGGYYVDRYGKGRGMASNCFNSNEQNETLRKMVAKGEFLSKPEKALFSVDWVATGMMLVHRRVYEKIVETDKDVFPITHTASSVKGLNFNILLRDDQFPLSFFSKYGADEGEDVLFCRRVRAAGFQPYLDLSVHASHQGIIWRDATNSGSFY